MESSGGFNLEPMALGRTASVQRPGPAPSFFQSRADFLADGGVDGVSEKLMCLTGLSSRSTQTYTCVHLWYTCIHFDWIDVVHTLQRLMIVTDSH